MADFIGGHGQPGIDRSEHIGANQGENIEAKRVAGYVWNGSTWERGTGGAAKLATKIANPSTGIYYIGKAPTGSSAASAVWQISKLDTTTLALEKTWADGNANFDNVWNDRAGYTYS